MAKDPELALFYKRASARLYVRLLKYAQDPRMRRFVEMVLRQPYDEPGGPHLKVRQAERIVGSLAAIKKVADGEA